jgi:phosphatidylglycerol---prolipoprotein diacylglyceryl transferase
MYPILLHFGPVVVPSYGVFAALAVLAGLGLALRTARQQGVDANKLWNLGIIALFAGAVAAKLVMVVLHWQDFRAAPLMLLNLSALSGGTQGWVAGGVALAVVFIYSLRTRMPVRGVLDALTAPVLLALSIESVGCLLAGCGWGTPTTAPWGIKFHSLIALVLWGTPMGVPLEPVQILTAIADVLLALLVLWMGTWGLRTGRLAGLGLFIGGIVHFLLQFWRGDVETLAWTNGWLTAGQVVCLAMIAAATILWWEPREWRLAVPSEEAAEAGR